MFFEGFTRTEIKTSGARIVTVHGGKGPPVLLMHGNPFTHLSWHKIAPRLAEEFTVVATDLRGYGDSEKPPGGVDHSRLFLPRHGAGPGRGHGARLATPASTPPVTTAAHVCCTACASTIRTTVDRAAIIDIIPQHHLYNNVTRNWATFSWHWFFNIQPYDLPERMMGFDPDWFIKKKLAKTEQWLELLRSRGARGIHALLPQPADYPRDLRGLPRRRQHRPVSTTTPTSRRAARSAARCCCSGAPPAASAATPIPWRSGRAMPPTSAPARRCRAATTSRTKRPTRPCRELRAFFGEGGLK